MSADAVKNFCKVEVSGYYGTSETSITLKTGEGSKLPSPPFNLVWWNATDYQDPADDPYREIVRVTAINGDILTVSRGQEDTTAQPHNISGKLYKMIRPITAKDYEDLQKIDIYKDGSLIGSRPKIDFRGGEVSDDSLNNKVNVFLTGNFAARATNPPSLQLYVSRGQVIIEGVYAFFSGGNSPSFSIPTNYPRIDLLCLNSSGNLEIVQGTESSTPTAPTYPANKFVICEVYNRPNETCIKDSNDNTNGYIYRDVRAFIGNNPNVFSFIAGESLKKGEPLYVGSDGKVYACDAADTSKINFIGFANNNVAASNVVPVIVTGIANIFSGLSPGAIYYVQNRTYQIDQSQTAGVDYVGNPTLWQSFTPSVSNLAGVGVHLRNSGTSPQSSNITLNIHDGEGTAGTILSSVSFSVTIGGNAAMWVNVGLPSPLSLVVGQKYTIALTFSPYNSIGNWMINLSSDAYSGGRSSYSSTTDFNFKTYSLLITNIGTSPGTNSVKAGIAISSTALKIAT